MQRPVVVGHCHSRAEVIRGNDALHRQDLRVPVNKVASPFDGDLKQGNLTGLGAWPCGRPPSRHRQCMIRPRSESAIRRVSALDRH